MSRYINAEIVKERLKEIFENFGERIVINSIVDEIPTADVKEVIHGEWKKHMGDFYKCTNCSVCTLIPKHPDGSLYNFCPYCGACLKEEND